MSKVGYCNFDPRSGVFLVIFASPAAVNQNTPPFKRLYSVAVRLIKENYPTLRYITQNFVKFTYSGGSHPEMVQHVGGFMQYSYREHSAVQFLKKVGGSPPNFGVIQIQRDLRYFHLCCINALVFFSRCSC